MISIKHKKIQTWKLPFELEGLKIDRGATFKTQENDAVIILKPSDKDRIHGEIVFRLHELPDCEDDNRCATGIGKVSIESVFRSDFVISAPIDTVPLKIICDENALYADERLVSEFKIEKVKQIPIPECSFTVSAASTTMDLKRFISFLEKLKTHPEKETLDRCKKWFKRGIEEKDTVNKFVMYWIAFNSLYSLFQKNGDQKNIKELLNDHPKDMDTINKILDKHNRIINSLCQKNLTSRDDERNYSDDLKKSLLSTQNHRKMQSIGMCLWQVRNNVFHGGNTPEDEKIFIGECASLLNDIVRSAMYSYVVK